VSDLTLRQKAFVDAYTSGPTFGNATRSAAASGHRGTDESLAVAGHRLLNNVKVAAELERRHGESRTAAVMDLRERKELLTKVARGEITEPKTLGSGPTASVVDICQTKDRIRAVEVLGKIEGDFVERVEHVVVDPDRLARLAAMLRDDESDGS
jgi:phage terminase small subunit